MPARIGLVGAGWWAQGWHLPQLARNPKAVIAAIVDPSTNLRSTLNEDMEQLEALGTRYSCPTYTSADALFAAADGQHLDGVVIASNHASHFDICKTALAHGAHVLCEKPMTTSPRDAWALAEMVSARPEQYFSINNTANWRRNTVLAHDLVSNKKRLGKVEHMSCYMGSPLLWLFDDPDNAHWCQPSGDMLGNGFGWGQMSHVIAWALRVTELTPADVFCEMRHSKRSGADLYDTVLIRCVENDATIAVQGTATLPGENPVAQKRIENKIYGEEGYLEYSGYDLTPDSGRLELRRHDGDHETYPGFEFENYEDGGLGPESLQAFVDVCAGDQKLDAWNGCDAETGAKVVSVIEAMYRSSSDPAGSFVRVA